MVDGFERGNINPYRGSVDAWGTTTSTASQGSYSLAAPGGGVNRSILSRPGDGLNHYPSRGETIKVDFRVGNYGGKFYFMFGHGSGSIEEDSYELIFYPGGDEIVLVNDTGADYRLDSSYHNFGSRAFRTATIDWHANGIDVEYAGTTLSTGNTARDSGGVGFFCDGSAGYFDNVRAV